MDRVDLDKNRDDESLDWENTRAMSFVYNSMFRKPIKTSNTVVGPDSGIKKEPIFE